MKNVIVRKSKIHNKGVFTNRGFKKGEGILEINDSHVVKNLSKLTERQIEFECDFLENGKVVLMQAPEKYINHSCNPNTYVKTINSMRKLLAMRDIKKGEEITYDYAVNGYYNTAIKCHCGSKNCRKILNCNFFKLPKKIQLRYLPYLDDWFVKQFRGRIRKIQGQT